ncbi:MAG: hypothetical protein IJE62_00860 [Clostridia bacterium]|nr:hypothetical protein [Clostridia bacterium]MBQ9940026.1 hypothetical protein [Clostridia bacterium]
MPQGKHHQRQRHIENLPEGDFIDELTTAVVNSIKNFLKTLDFISV